MAEELRNIKKTPKSSIIKKSIIKVMDIVSSNQNKKDINKQLGQEIRFIEAMSIFIKDGVFNKRKAEILKEYDFNVPDERFDGLMRIFEELVALFYRRNILTSAMLKGE